jgi:hypothetical protein
VKNLEERMNKRVCKEERKKENLENLERKRMRKECVLLKSACPVGVLLLKKQ